MKKLLSMLDAADAAALWAVVSGLANAMYSAGDINKENDAFMILYGFYKLVMREISGRLERDFIGGQNDENE